MDNDSDMGRLLEVSNGQLLVLKGNILFIYQSAKQKLGVQGQGC